VIWHCGACGEYVEGYDHPMALILRHLLECPRTRVVRLRRHHRPFPTARRR
jgi:hypothetical protein